MKNRFGVKAEDCYIQHTVIGYGVHQFACLWTQHFSPIGFVWVHLFTTSRGTMAVILDSYVPVAFRRSGIRSLINKEILKQADAIMSSDTSTKFGMSFMKAKGYKRSKETGLMYLHKRKA